ncbi:MAG: PleD family two-component response regulator [Candidatus Omnitrophota bacterium]|jgi:PleD family two-component response regulator
MSKILIVDDTMLNRELLKEILITTDQNYELIEAESGTECLEMVAANEIDLILLDVMMPGMSGHEVCTTLKAGEETKSIPIIFITALTAEDDLAKGFELGAADYITKPINAVEVSYRVDNQIKLKDAVKTRLDMERMGTLKDMITTYNHHMNQPLMAAFMYLDAMQTRATEAKDQTTLVKIKNELVKMKEILEKIQAIKEVKRTNYVGDTGMVDI